MVRQYVQVTDTQRSELVRLIHQENLSISKASQITNIPYDNAKAINRTYLKEQRVNKINYRLRYQKNVKIPHTLLNRSNSGYDSLINGNSLAINSCQMSYQNNIRSGLLMGNTNPQDLSNQLFLSKQAMPLQQQHQSPFDNLTKNVGYSLSNPLFPAQIPHILINNHQQGYQQAGTLINNINNNNTNHPNLIGLTSQYANKLQSSNNLITTTPQLVLAQNIIGQMPGNKIESQQKTILTQSTQSSSSFNQSNQNSVNQNNNLTQTPFVSTNNNQSLFLQIPQFQQVNSSKNISLNGLNQINQPNNSFFTISQNQIIQGGINPSILKDQGYNQSLSLSGIRFTDQTQRMNSSIVQAQTDKFTQEMNGKITGLKSFVATSLNNQQKDNVLANNVSNISSGSLNFQSLVPQALKPNINQQNISTKFSQENEISRQNLECQDINTQSKVNLIHNSEAKITKIHHNETINQSDLQEIQNDKFKQTPCQPQKLQDKANSATDKLIQNHQLSPKTIESPQISNNKLIDNQEKTSLHTNNLDKDNQVQNVQQNPINSASNMQIQLNFDCNINKSNNTSFDINNRQVINQITKANNENGNVTQNINNSDKNIRYTHQNQDVNSKKFSDNSQKQQDEQISILGQNQGLPEAKQQIYNIAHTSQNINSNNDMQQNLLKFQQLQYQQYLFQSQYSHELLNQLSNLSKSHQEAIAFTSNGTIDNLSNNKFDFSVYEQPILLNSENKIKGIETISYRRKLKLDQKLNKPNMKVDDYMEMNDDNNESNTFILSESVNHTSIDDNKKSQKEKDQQMKNSSKTNSNLNSNSFASPQFKRDQDQINSLNTSNQKQQQFSDQQIREDPELSCRRQTRSMLKKRVRIIDPKEDENNEQYWQKFSNLNSQDLLGRQSANKRTYRNQDSFDSQFSSAELNQQSSQKQKSKIYKCATTKKSDDILGNKQVLRKLNLQTPNKENYNYEMKQFDNHNNQKYNKISSQKQVQYKIPNLVKYLKTLHNFE